MDLWVSVKLISENLKKFYRTDRVLIAIQDGEDSGQTVPHVHVHLIPRINDQNQVESDKIDLESRTRINRSLDEMAKEAKNYRDSFSFY